MKTDVDSRLARIEGQVRGVRKMAGEGAYCTDVLTQLAAIRAAIEQVSAMVASNHIKHCIAEHGEGTGHHKAEAMSKDELMAELDLVLKRLMR